MGVEAVGSNVKKLSKNKFFMIGLLVILVMAFYTIFKKDNSKGDNSTLVSPSSVGGYPTVGENANTVVDTVGKQIAENNKSMLDMFADLSVGMQIDKADILTGIKESGQSTNDYIKNSFDDLYDKNSLYNQNILDKIGNTELNLADKLSQQGMSIKDQISMSQERNQQNYEKLNNDMHNIGEGIRNEVYHQGNRVINKVDYLGNKIDTNRKQESQEHSLLAENINQNYDYLYNKLNT